MLVVGLCAVASLVPAFVVAAQWCEGAYDAEQGSNFGMCPDVEVQPLVAPTTPAGEPVSVHPNDTVRPEPMASPVTAADVSREPTLAPPTTESEQQQQGQFRSPRTVGQPGAGVDSGMPGVTGQSREPETESEQQQRGEFRSPRWVTPPVRQETGTGTPVVEPRTEVPPTPETESEQQQRGEFRSPGSITPGSPLGTVEMPMGGTGMGSGG
jgi:hypothetical protein